MRFSEFCGVLPGGCVIEVRDVNNVNVCVIKADSRGVEPYAECNVLLATPDAYNHVTVKLEY